MTLIKSYNYPNRAAKFLRSTFELSKLDGMGHALMEEQQLEELKTKVKEYSFRELAAKNETSERVQRMLAFRDGNLAIKDQRRIYVLRQKGCRKPAVVVVLVIKMLVP